MSKIITIKKFPNFQCLARNIYCNISKLTDRQLINRYGKILAAMSAHEMGGLSPSTVSEAWQIENMKFLKGEMDAEMKKRNIYDKYCFFIELLK